MERDDSTATAIFRRSSGRGADARTSLPDDLLTQASRRLRALALVYAFVFFMSSFVTSLVLGGGTGPEFENTLPSAVSIVAALLVAWMTTQRRIPPSAMLHIGLAFEVVGSYGIAMAQYWGVYRGLAYQVEHLEIFGLSWVAVWMLLFSIVVPAKPKPALIATVASASAVPVVMVLTMKYGGTPIRLTGLQFGFGLILPYLLVILMAHVGARVIYTMGAEVAKARDMGSYHLEERLGEGGMGEVWRARHRLLARPAAIKLIRPDVRWGDHDDAMQLALKRFEREAQATAAMRSPHTIELFDFGIAADGAFYYVMELLNGFDLESLVADFGPVPPERAIFLLRQACDSLGEAHEQGLIHRDIKPANMYVCRYGRHVDFVKVLDFGLVKHHGEAAASTRLTTEAFAGGTPAYMSPEQAAGDREVDGRSDLYSLGCVAYWLVTGALVFEGTAMRSMLMHLQEAPVPPSQRAKQDIPASFEQVVMRCLEKDPDRRPQSADELDRMLAGCLIPSEWSEARARAWWESVARRDAGGGTAPGTT